VEEMEPEVELEKAGEVEPPIGAEFAGVEFGVPAGGGEENENGRLEREKEREEVRTEGGEAACGAREAGAEGCGAGAGVASCCAACAAIRIPFTIRAIKSGD